MEIGQISFYLAKAGHDFTTVLQQEKLPPEGEKFNVRMFEVDGHKAKFFCFQSEVTKAANPPWLDFINQKISPDENQVHFSSYNKRPSGLLLLEIDNNILAASFGTKGRSWLEKSHFLSDFGIKTAMNMCGNTEVRQTKSSTHAITTKHIDRQVSRPSDAFAFGLDETEFLRYISAQLESNKKVSLQGKDSLTIKISGDKKLSWESLIEYGKTFIEKYGDDKYKTTFPNYPNLQDVEEEKASELDSLILGKLQKSEYSCIHLAIPEFIADDQYSFSYTNNENGNVVYSYIDVKHLQAENIIRGGMGKATITTLKNKSIYAYSHAEDKVLSHVKWSLYACIVAEAELSGKYYVLSGGVWRQVDEIFYNSVNNFIKNDLQEIAIAQEYQNIDISVQAKKQNREEEFNKKYCSINRKSILFDKAKLRIGHGAKDKEFCDILEIQDGSPIEITHVKKYGSASDLNYLFSQSKFYCESFLGDRTFLSEIRNHISVSGHEIKDEFLAEISDDIAKIKGENFIVNMWVLYNKSENKPDRNNLPLISKYELKIAYERLRNILKFNRVNLCFIPVHMVNFKTDKTKPKK